MTSAPSSRLVARRLPDADATDHLGAALGRALKAGDCVLLSGPLGAGKSALARAAIQARLADLGRYEDVPSPTFTLVQIYPLDQLELRHADLYRLSAPEEAEEIGLFDDMDHAIALIEWGERLGASTPSRRLEIALDLPSDRNGRMLQATAYGEGWEPALKALEGDAA